MPRHDGRTRREPCRQAPTSTQTKHRKRKTRRVYVDRFDQPIPPVRTPAKRRACLWSFESGWVVNPGGRWIAWGFET